MNLTKAIEIKENRLGDKKPYYSEEIEEADRLSIQAMSYIQRIREVCYLSIIPPLPGETRE